MEKIRDKIRKLLKLARDKGASENEAASAMAMASRLMLQHNIEHVGDEEEETRAVRGNWMGIRRDDKWERMTASAVATLFNCRSVTNGLGDHSFAGKPSNIDACQDTFVWVCEQIEELYKEGLKTFKTRMGGLDKMARSDFRKTFKEACALRVWRRIGEIIAANRGQIPSHRVLVVIDQSLAAADDLLKDLKKGRSLAIRRSGLGTGAGLAAGDTVKLQGNLRGQAARITTGD